MTGVAALQSYLENSFAYWRYGGGSFATLDTDALLQLSFQKTETEEQIPGKEIGDDLGFVPSFEICFAAN